VINEKTLFVCLLLFDGFKKSFQFFFLLTLPRANECWHCSGRLRFCPELYKRHHLPVKNPAKKKTKAILVGALEEGMVVKSELEYSISRIKPVHGHSNKISS